MNPDPTQLLLTVESPAIPRAEAPPEDAVAPDAADIRRMLEATDDIVARALSQDSARYLEDVRQHGGQ